MLERAHLDGDRRNDALENRAVLCRRCHRRADYARWSADYRAWQAQQRAELIARRDAARELLAGVPLLTFEVPEVKPWLAVQ